MTATTTITLTVHGKPTPKGRPRFTSAGRTYTPARTRAAEATLLSYWLAESDGRQPHDGPVTILIEAVFEVPKSWPKFRRSAALAGSVAHQSRPDVDNLLKLVDGLNGHAWRDDAQIVEAVIVKGYGPDPLTRFTIHFHPTTTPTKGTTNDAGNL